MRADAWWKIAGAAALLTLGVAAKGKRVEVPATVGPTIVPAANVFLRTSFDTDPSVYVGRFVKDGVAIPDESAASKKACSTFVSYRTVGAGNVEYDEMFNASTSAAASVGVPIVASAGVSGADGRTVRVKYKLSRKIVADVEDPAGFEACCKKAPDQCTGRYIGEFLEGTGSVYYGLADGATASGSGVTGAGVGVDVEFKHGMSWKRSITFDSPVFFAFKTTDTGVAAPEAPNDCASFPNAPPRSSEGMYFIGMSDPMETERLARDAARRDARLQTVEWLGEAIETGTVQISATGGPATDLTTLVQQQGALEAATQGVASYVKDEGWCVQAQATPKGTTYVGRVLALLPNAAMNAAAGSAATAAGSGKAP